MPFGGALSLSVEDATGVEEEKLDESEEEETSTSSVPFASSPSPNLATTLSE